VTSVAGAPDSGLVQKIVLCWATLYTAGLAASSRARRFVEVRSDLWEHKTDRIADGVSPALVGIEILGRAVRGVPADLLWRFQLEGPKMNINIPIQRLAGACLIFLVVAAMLSLNVAGYDSDRQGFEGELRRLADIKGWQVGMYTGLQVLSGLGMLGGAVILGLALRRYSATVALLAAVAMACAGLLTLVTSAIYATAADLADEWSAASPGHSDQVLTVARAFVLVLKSLVPVTAFSLALGVYGFATITARHRLVPHWLAFVAGGSAVALAIAMFSGMLTDSGVTWGALMIGMGLLLLWLIVAGGWLLLGGSNEEGAGDRKDEPAEGKGLPRAGSI
jgi:hypothetical protein